MAEATVSAFGKQYCRESAMILRKRPQPPIKEVATNPQGPPRRRKRLFRLLDLPREIRDKIYAFIISNGGITIKYKVLSAYRWESDLQGRRTIIAPLYGPLHKVLHDPPSRPSRSRPMTSPVVVTGPTVPELPKCFNILLSSHQVSDEAIQVLYGAQVFKIPFEQSEAFRLNFVPFIGTRNTSYIKKLDFTLPECLKTDTAMMSAHYAELFNKMPKLMEMIIGTHFYAHTSNSRIASEYSSILSFSANIAVSHTLLNSATFLDMGLREAIAMRNDPTLPRSVILAAKIEIRVRLTVRTTREKLDNLLNNGGMMLDAKKISDAGEQATYKSWDPKNWALDCGKPVDVITTIPPPDEAMIKAAKEELEEKKSLQLLRGTCPAAATSSKHSASQSSDTAMQDLIVALGLTAEEIAAQSGMLEMFNAIKNTAADTAACSKPRHQTYHRALIDRAGDTNPTSGMPGQPKKRKIANDGGTDGNDDNTRKSDHIKKKQGFRRDYIPDEMNFEMASLNTQETSIRSEGQELTVPAEPRGMSRVENFIGIATLFPSTSKNPSSLDQFAHTRSLLGGPTDSSTSTTASTLAPPSASAPISSQVDLQTPLGTSKSRFNKEAEKEYDRMRAGFAQKAIEASETKGKRRCDSTEDWESIDIDEWLDDYEVVKKMVAFGNLSHDDPEEEDDVEDDDYMAEEAAEDFHAEAVQDLVHEAVDGDGDTAMDDHMMKYVLDQLY